MFRRWSRTSTKRTLPEYKFARFCVPAGHVSESAIINQSSKPPKKDPRTGQSRAKNSSCSCGMQRLLPRRSFAHQILFLLLVLDFLFLLAVYDTMASSMFCSSRVFPCAGGMDSGDCTCSLEIGGAESKAVENLE